MAPKKKRVVSALDSMQHYMKVVTVDTCILCKQQCLRGLAYMEKMEQPGAVGHGVACILTRGKPGIEQKGKKK